MVRRSGRCPRQTDMARQRCDFFGTQIIIESARFLAAITSPVSNGWNVNGLLEQA
jgi:hypothetical protein